MSNQYPSYKSPYSPSTNKGEYNIESNATSSIYNDQANSLFGQKRPFSWFVSNSPFRMKQAPWWKMMNNTNTQPQLPPITPTFSNMVSQPTNNWSNPNFLSSSSSNPLTTLLDPAELNVQSPPLTLEQYFQKYGLVDGLYEYRKSQGLDVEAPTGNTMDEFLRFFYSHGPGMTVSRKPEEDSSSPLDSLSTFFDALMEHRRLLGKKDTFGRLL